jgi:hypothetical protein
MLGVVSAICCHPLHDHKTKTNLACTA